MDAISLWLPVVWAAIIAVAVALYVILDGFDLGIAILFPLAPTTFYQQRLEIMEALDRLQSYLGASIR